MVNKPIIEEVEPMASGMPSSFSHASPFGPQLSMTTSATSASFLPEGWREGQASLCARFRIAATRRPFSRPSNAISMGTALRPELDTTTSTSPAATG